MAFPIQQSMDEQACYDKFVEVLHPEGQGQPGQGQPGQALRHCKFR